VPSLLRTASFFALALATFVAGCDEDDPEPVYLGVVDGSALPDAAEPDASPDAPEIGNLTVSECDNQPSIQGPDASSVVRFASARLGNDMGQTARLVLTVHDGINAYDFDASGCPGQPVAGFGTAGHVAIDAIAAVSLGSYTLVATPERTLVLNQAGIEEASCLAAGSESDVRTRWLGSTGGSLAVGVFVRSPLALIGTGVDGPCYVDWLNLEQSPEVVVAATRVTNGKGFVVVEQSTASSPLTVSRYDDNGKRSAAGPNLPSSPVLCSVTGLVDTPQGILVADGACKQLVLYDAVTLQPIKQALLDGAPRGLAWPGGTKVLVPVARPTATGAEAVLQLVELAN